MCFFALVVPRCPVQLWRARVCVDSLSSRGCHRLIRDGARLVETVDDILDEFGPLVKEVRTDPGEPPVRHPAELALCDSERSLLGQLDDTPTSTDRGQSIGSGNKMTS
jgi:predicted Rossmann fold nucleotide-binding protein DprA/Smf involved in DNA uptake